MCTIKTLCKKEARQLALSLRKDIKVSVGDFIDKIKPHLKGKKVVAIYYPLPGEINLLPLVDLFSNIKFVFPQTRDVISFHEVDAKGFNQGPFNTFEPCGKELKKEKIDLIITPALAINKHNYRLGYGKGYYDKYLSDYKGDTLCIISKKLVLNFLEDSFDVKVKEVLLI